MLSQNSIAILSLIIIITTIIGVAFGRYPFLRMNRATIALVGAVMLVIINALPMDDALKLINLDTIALLFAVMVLNVNFRLSGFFNLLSNAIIKIAGTPKKLLLLFIMSSGILSALFLNDTIVLVMTPIIIQITIALKRNPIPYLIALAASANIGSAGTIIGNPQNIIIGTASQISFSRFALYLSPLALFSLLIIWLVIVLLYRTEFKTASFEQIELSGFRVHKPLLRKSILASVVMLAALFAGVNTSLAAISAASVLLVTRRLKPERVFKEIDWALLVFFSGLFIVTGALESLGFSKHLFNILKLNTGNDIADLSIISVLLSNLVSNVPAVLLLKPVIISFTDVQTAWLTLAMATTFAGNLTLLGSVANLIVAETAKKNNVVLSFNEYLKAGIPITIISVLIGILWLNIF